MQEEGWEPRWLRRTLLGYPGAMLAILFLLPLVSLLVFSFYTHVSGHGLYEARFTWANYAKALEPFYLLRLWFTIWFSALTAAICLVLGVPFTYVVTHLRSAALRRWIIGLTVSTLWLTDIVRAYGWSVVFSRTAGIGKLFAVLGLTAVPQSYAPGFMATLVGMVYVYFPFMVLSLFGALRDLNPELEEASMMLGASRAYTMFRIVLPLIGRAMVIGTVFVFLLAVGTFIIPDVLGSPPQWNTSVMITDAVVFNSNIPFGSALSVVLAIVIGVPLLAFSSLARPGRR